MGREEDNVSRDQGDGITSLAVRVQIGQDRLSSCLNLMACVITRARLDSIAVVVPESVHSHRDQGDLGRHPPEAKGPCLRSAVLFRVCTAASIHLLGRNARKHRASRQPTAMMDHLFNTSSNTPPALHLISIKTFFLGSRSKPERQKADLARFGRSIPCGEEPAAHTIRYSARVPYCTMMHARILITIS
jgi:hypothetical protein